MTTERTLETSEQEFADRFAAYAATGELYPQREGSPLLEFVAGGRVLYLFDRCGPYAARPGAARVVVHGMLDPAQTAVLGSPAEESLSVQGVSALSGCGQVLEASRRVWVVQARVPLVLAAFAPLPPVRAGDWVQFVTLPPLHGFVLHGAE
ncbi:MAG: hypothetical protein Q4C89_09920 [Deinococcus sp.]|uniref:hypothetical protein n=1 Tax=Deinococcus sp. TaxID=47478 RepID=UPI0026DD4729|nr:hypothetical protein [Deinococcus sp.]MDO4246328.1 hypothetical protein [Deinococcus sp.]